MSYESSDEDELEFGGHPYEAMGEFAEEIGEEYIPLPAGYLAAEGNYKMFCTCDNLETCAFCRMFSSIKSCEAHGQATEPKFKPCKCPVRRKKIKFKSDDRSSGSSSVQSFSKSTHHKICRCVVDVRPRLVQKCDCTERMVHSSDSDDSLNAKKKSPHSPIAVGSKAMGDSDESAENNMENLAKEVSAADCHCLRSIRSRDGSTTDYESTSRKSDDGTSSGSYADFIVGGHLVDVGGSSSGVSDSEQTSTEHDSVDWTKIKCVNYASDRSVESMSDVEYDADEVDKWTLSKIDLTNRGEEGQSIRPEDTTKKAERKGANQYLLAKRKIRKAVTDICSENEIDPIERSYHLVNLEMP